jgi:zinc transport system permease protein
LSDWLYRLELFEYALLAALCAGLVCPLLGAFLYLRCTSFYGITLPQLATAGVVFGLAIMPWWAANVGLGVANVETAMSDSHAAMSYHVAWAAVFTFGGLLWLERLARRSGADVGRVAAAFAIASAATIVFSRLAAEGAHFVGELLQGEVLGIGVHEFEQIAVLFGLVLAAFWLFHRDLAFVSYDREMALVLGKRVVAFETLLTAITGATVSVGTMTLGPTILFGLLVLPPLAARRLTSSMVPYLVASSAIGVLSVALGVVAAFELDLPLGAAIVGAAALALVPAALLGARRR